ncbi:DUF1439 domain-containing protein [Pseudoxanthomonas mexicana]|uniref:DUF1439 domain-containing protein n=1 Tax=Pseudoxanthomonas mexicana TaxID=128785 RepID=UPI00398ADBEE
MPLRHPARLMFLLSLLLALSACNTVGGMFGNQLDFTQPQLQRYLDRSFPREFDKLGGLVSATLSRPRLSIPDGERRLRLDFDVRIDALGGSEVARGQFAMASALRYDPATRGLHLQSPEILDIRIPGGGDLLRGGTRGLLNAVLADYAAQEPIYRIDEDLLRRLPMGRRIGSTTIEDGRVLVHLTGN